MIDQEFEQWVIKKNKSLEADKCDISFQHETNFPSEEDGVTFTQVDYYNGDVDGFINVGSDGVCMMGLMRADEWVYYDEIVLNSKDQFDEALDLFFMFLS